MENNSSNGTTINLCHPFFNQDFKCDIIFWFRCIIAILSMVACLFVVFIIIVFKKYKFLYQRLILNLSIGAFFQGLVYATDDYKQARSIADGEQHGFCVFLGICTLYLDWFSFLWVCCITFNIFWNAVFGKRTEKFEKFYYALCIGLPALIACFPFIGDSYGSAGLWCWIRSSSYNSTTDTLETYTTGIILQFTLFYGPLWTISLFLLFVLLYVACLIRHRSHKYHGIYSPQIDAQKKLWEEEIRPLLLFPWIYLFILIFPVMNRLRLAAGFFEPDSAANFWFWFSHACFLTLHGSLYALVFACDRQTRSRITYPQIKAALLQRAMRRKKIKGYPVTNSREEEDDIISPVHDSNAQISSGSYKLLET